MIVSRLIERLVADRITSSLTDVGLQILAFRLHRNGDAGGGDVLADAVGFSAEGIGARSGEIDIDRRASADGRAIQRPRMALLTRQGIDRVLLYRTNTGIDWPRN